MTATDARNLRPNDWVIATFSGRAYTKRCRITHIQWPTFHLETTDCTGKLIYRSRRYPSIRKRAPPPNQTPTDNPTWLIWPTKPTEQP